MANYEKCFTNYQDAQKTAKIVGGTIHTFISMDANGEYITIYAVRYKQLF